MRWVGLGARLLCAAVWLWAGLIKLPDLNASVTAVRGYQVLPENLVEPVGLVLPLIEVLIGVFLLVGLWVRPAALVSAVLFVGFIIGLVSVWARGIEIDCGCFGGGGAEAGASTGYPWEIARDVLLLAASVWLVLRPRTPFSLDAVRSVDPDVDPVPDSLIERRG